MTCALVIAISKTFSTAEKAKSRIENCKKPSLSLRYTRSSMILGISVMTGGAIIDLVQPEHQFQGRKLPFNTLHDHDSHFSAIRRDR